MCHGETCGPVDLPAVPRRWPPTHCRCETPQSTELFRRSTAGAVLPASEFIFASVVMLGVRLECKLNLAIDNVLPSLGL